MSAATDRERIREHAARLAAQAPPLSDSQRQRLAVLLRPVPVPRR